MSAVLEFKIALEHHTCPNCFIEFAVPPRLIQERRIDKESFYCPNGHSMSFQQSELDRVKTELDRAKRDLKWAREAADRNRERANKTERQLRATKGALTRVKKRVGKGVCPCCNRTFINVQRHMASQHPQYSDEDNAL